MVISKLVLALQTFADMVIGFAKARPKISTAESGATPRLYGWQVAQSSGARSEEELLLRKLTKHGLIKNFAAILSITSAKKLFTRQCPLFVWRGSPVFRRYPGTQPVDARRFVDGEIRVPSPRGEGKGEGKRDVTHPNAQRNRADSIPPRGAQRLFARVLPFSTSQKLEWAGQQFFVRWLTKVPFPQTP